MKSKWFLLLAIGIILASCDMTTNDDPIIQMPDVTVLKFNGTTIPLEKHGTYENFYRLLFYWTVEMQNNTDKLDIIWGKDLMVDVGPEYAQMYFRLNRSNGNNPS
jgi:hypothetical protein